MGNLITLDDDIKGVIILGLDDLITELGKNCRLVYPPKIVPCDCVMDTVGGKPTNHGAHGGPAGFPSICPLCKGSHKKEVENTEIIRLLCAYIPKKYQEPAPTTRVPESHLRTKGYLTDVPKVMKANYLVFQTDVEGSLQKRYKLIQPPADKGNIIQGRYFVAVWEQI